MSTAAEREILLGHVVRPPIAIVRDIRDGALKLAFQADIWTQIPPATPGAVSAEQGLVACLARLLIDSRVALHEQESSRAA